MAAILDAHDPEMLPAVRELFLEYGRSLDFELCFQSFDRELAELPGAYAPPRGRLLLAREGGADAGCVALRPLEGDACEMKRLYVRPAHRGHGLARALVSRLLSDARALGYARVRLDTVPAMREAQALYHALGFRDIEAYTKNPVPGARFLELELEGRGA